MGLLGSLGSFLSGPITSAVDGLATGFVNEYFDRRQMKYQNNLMRENWDLMNAYNTPSAQMERYKEAGLNPNLIYGQSNTTGSIGTPSATSKGFDPSIGLQMANLKADNENKRQQNALLASQADYVKQQTKSQMLENLLRGISIKSLTGSSPLDSNPNDPYWFRDAKKMIRFIFDKSFMPSRGVSAVPDIGPTVLDAVTPDLKVRSKGRYNHVRWDSPRG